MYVQVQFLYNIMKYSNNFNFFSTQASQQRASTPYSWSTGLVDSTSQVQNWIQAINIIYQFQPYYCHPPQVSSLGCAPHLPRFRLHGPPRRAGWRDWSTACRDVIALIRQVNGERSPIGIKFKPIPATSTNIIQAWQFWLPLHLPRVPLPSSPPCDWRNLKEKEAAHEAIIYYA